MKRYAIFLLFLTSYSWAQSNIWDEINKEFADRPKEQVIEDKNCKSGYSLNGNCIEVLQVNIKELNAAAKKRADRKHDDVLEDVLEMEAKQLDDLRKGFSELMKSSDPKLKDLQDTFKSFGVDYEKILTLVFSHYIKNATKFLEKSGKAENVVMDFFENCNEQEFQNVEMLKFFLINDLGQVLILIV